MWKSVREPRITYMTAVYIWTTNILLYLSFVVFPFAGVSQRTARRFTRRWYFSSGPNFIWHIDGYDKLKPYGLCIHGCICGFSRKILWLNVYKTNNSPRVIAGYFLETVKKYGGTAKMIRGDFGTENVLVRDMQRYFRSNDITTSYIAGAGTQNQRIESWWGYLRREHLQYWIDLFSNLKEIQAFSGSELDKNLVLFCFMAIIQVFHKKVYCSHRQIYL